MSEKNIDFGKTKVETATITDSFESAIGKFRKALLAILVVFVLAVIAIVVGIIVHSNSVKSGLEKVDTVYFSLSNAKSDISADEVKALQNSSIETLLGLSKSSGIVGMRASMLLGELYFQQGKFDESRNAWLAAANVEKNSYTNSVSYYNAAACSESLNDLDSAVKYYELASSDSDFLLVDHALFSLARVYEAKKDSAKATETYQKLNDLHPNSSWANLAKTRLIALKVKQ